MSILPNERLRYRSDYPGDRLPPQETTAQLRDRFEQWYATNVADDERKELFWAAVLAMARPDNESAKPEHVGSDV